MLGYFLIQTHHNLIRTIYVCCSDFQCRGYPYNDLTLTARIFLDTNTSQLNMHDIHVCML